MDSATHTGYVLQWEISMSDNRRDAGFSPVPSSSQGRDGVYGTTAASASDDVARQAFRYRSFTCPRCHTLLSATKEEVGKKIVCPDCEASVVVPDYLDFDTPTEYERQYYNESKRERDRIISPLTNPNREGVESVSGDVYSVRADHTTRSSVDDVVFYPVRCRVCETLMQATSEMLGREIVCPDCGTRTTVTDALKKQQDALKVKFEPRPQETYGIGAIPEAPVVTLQKTDGTTIAINPNEREIAPTLSEVFEQKKKSNPDMRSSVWDKSEQEKKSERLTEALRGEKSKFEQWLEKRAARREAKAEAAEDLKKFLPPMVLRYKNGVQVWALPSPPNNSPLFNKTFRAVFDQEIWARSGIVILGLVLIAAVYAIFIKPNYILDRTLELGMARSFAEWELLCSIVLGFALSLVTSSFAGVYFWSVFNGGNSGATRVVEWRSEDWLELALYGLWFFAFVMASAVPGILLGGCFSSAIIPYLQNHVFHDNSSDFIAKAAYWLLCTGGFWLAFPVFWISTHQTDLPFCPITGNVLASFFTKLHIWLEFYFVSAIFFFMPSFIWMMTFDSTFFLVVGTLLIPLDLMFYGLLLGRLSWIIDDIIRLQDYDD